MQNVPAMNASLVTATMSSISDSEVASAGRTLIPMMFLSSPYCVLGSRMTFRNFLLFAHLLLLFFLPLRCVLQSTNFTGSVSIMLCCCQLVALLCSAGSALLALLCWLCSAGSALFAQNSESQSAQKSNMHIN